MRDFFSLLHLLKPSTFVKDQGFFCSSKSLTFMVIMQTAAVKEIGFFLFFIDSFSLFFILRLVPTNWCTGLILEILTPVRYVFFFYYIIYLVTLSLNLSVSALIVWYMFINTENNSKYVSWCDIYMAPRKLYHSVMFLMVWLLHARVICLW